MTQTAHTPPETNPKQGDPKNPSPTEPIADQPKHPFNKINPRLAIPVVLIVGAIAYGIWAILPKPQPTSLEVSGRLESDETDIGAKTGGRVSEILVDEGDPVTKGQLVVEITDEEITAQLSGLTAQIESAQQEELQAKAEIAVAESRIREATLNLQQSEGDATGRIDQAQFTVSAAESDLRQAEAQVKQAEAQLQQAKAELQLAQVERDRYAALVKDGAVNQQQFDQKQTTLDTARARVETAEAQVIASRAAVKAAGDRFRAAQGNLVQVQATGAKPRHSQRPTRYL
jgi:HlyD family secretion protein